MKESDLYPYQTRTVEHQCSHPATAVWQDCGLGKTVASLTSSSRLLECGFLRGVLIVAPLRVCRLVWRQEAAKWEHTKHLTFSMVLGDRDQRVSALLRKADYYILNYENLKWLSETLLTYFISKGRPIPFNGIIWDEISKMKNSTTNRVKSFLRIMSEFHWFTGLTGTPASNGYKDLHGQFLVLDRGKRLGTSKTAFRERFYYKQGPYKEIAFADTEETIKNLIGDITLQMSAEDYNPLPDLIVNDIYVDLPPLVREQYDQLETEFFFELDNGKSVEVFNSASMTNKCLQFSNGAIYPISGLPQWEPVHDIKLEVLDDILEEASGQPVLCSYAYRSDAQRIMERFKRLDPINLTECKSERSLNSAMSRWATGDCPLMLGHPACLHERTQVLTEYRGWVSIIDVLPGERVFDGIEFVSHAGCSYSGYKEVITVLGITLTPNHKLWIEGKWVEAKNVDTSEKARRAAVYRGEIPIPGTGVLQSLWIGTSDPPPKLYKTSSTSPKVLPKLCGNSSHVSYQNLSDMVGDEESSDWEGESKIHSKLFGSRDRDLSRMVGFREFLRGHVTRVYKWSNDRTYRCERILRKEELSMGYQPRATREQKEQSSGDVSRGANSSGRTMQEKRVQQDDVIYEIESWDECRRSGTRRSKFYIRERSESKEKAHVYDLVDCGPRHQFVIRNDNGEVFLSHNSMGHGIDRLQESGHILCWFGLTWSLDLYEQFNARLRRQGQGSPVICNRILTQNTLDLVQATALSDKGDNQTSLRKAIKVYRDARGL